MQGRHFHYPVRFFSASLLGEAHADALTRIKRDDHLCDADLGAAMGKSADRAKAWRSGDAIMDALAWHRGVQLWGPRFADQGLALTGYRLCALTKTETPDRALPRPLTALTLKLMTAVENDEQVTDSELRDAGPEILAAGKIIDELRARLAGLATGENV